MTLHLETRVRRARGCILHADGGTSRWRLSADHGESVLKLGGKNQQRCANWMYIVRQVCRKAPVRPGGNSQPSPLG